MGLRSENRSRGDPSLPHAPAPLRLAGIHNLGLLGGLLALVVLSGRLAWPQELQARITASLIDAAQRHHKVRPGAWLWFFPEVRAWVCIRV